MHNRVSIRKSIESRFSVSLDGVVVWLLFNYRMTVTQCFVPFLTERTFVETTQAVGTIRPHTVLQVVGYLNRDVVVNLHSTVTPSRYAHLQLVMIPSASCATTTQSLPDGACIPPSQFSDLFLNRLVAVGEWSDA